MESKKNKAIYPIILTALVSILPFSFLSLGPVDIDLFKVSILVVCLFSFIAAAKKGKFFILMSKELLILLMMFFWFLLSGFWAKNIILTISHSFVFFIYIIFFLMVLLFTRTRNDLYTWIYFLPLTLLVAFIYDFRYLQTNIILRQADKALINTLGVASGISILPLLFIYLSTNKFLSKIYSLTGLVFCGLALILSGSRGGLLTVIFNILIFTFVLLRTGKVMLLKTAFLVISLLFIMFLVSKVCFLEAQKLFYARWVGLFNPEISQGIENYYWQENPRWKLWKAAFLMFEANPIGGIGFGNFAEEVLYVDPSLSFWTFSHNIYLDILSETGIVGFAIFLILIGICLKNYYITVKYLRKAKLKKDYFFVKTMETTFWGLLIYSAFRPAFFEFPLYLFMALSKVTKAVFLKRDNITRCYLLPH